MASHDCRGNRRLYFFWKIAIAMAIGRYQGAMRGIRLDEFQQSFWTPGGMN